MASESDVACGRLSSRWAVKERTRTNTACSLGPGAKLNHSFLLFGEDRWTELSLPNFV